VVVGRLIYPVVLIAATIVVLWLLARFVVPRFAMTLETLGGELPWQTVATLWLSGLLLWLVPVFVILTAVLVAARDSLISAKSKRKWSERLLRVPVAGGLIWHHQAGIVCDVLASMLEGGGDVLEAMEQSVDVIRSREIRARMETARGRVREGTDLGNALRGEGRTGVLPPLIAAVVGVGVRSGDLTASLRRAAEMCIERQERITQRLLTLMEPAIVLVLAACVGWVVYSLVVGMLAMTDLASG
jgi:type II secretory pathway component PulF